MHQRQLIRNAAVTVLTGLATTGANVFPMRTYPLAAAELPGLCVYTLAEESEDLAMGLSTRVLRRVLELAIEGVAQVNATLDDTLDAIAAEVEAALAGNPLFSPAIKDSLLIRSQIAVRKDAEKETGSIVLTYRVEYHTPAQNPHTGA